MVPLLFWVEFRKDLGKGLVVGQEVTMNAYPRTLRGAEELHRPEFLQINWKKIATSLGHQELGKQPRT